MLTIPKSVKGVLMKMQSISKQSTDDKHIGVIDIYRPVQPVRFGYVWKALSQRAVRSLD